MVSLVSLNYLVPFLKSSEEDINDMLDDDMGSYSESRAPSARSERSARGERVGGGGAGFGVGAATGAVGRSAVAPLHLGDGEAQEVRVSHHGQLTSDHGAYQAEEEPGRFRPAPNVSTPEAAAAASHSAECKLLRCLLLCL